jgi:hypothetical protein
MQLVARKPAWLSPKIATFRYPLSKPFTQHMSIYWCIQVLLPFPRPAGLGEAAGAGPAGARFAVPPPLRPTCTAGRGGEALPSASPRRLRRRRRHCRCGCRAEAVAKAAGLRLDALQGLRNLSSRICTTPLAPYMSGVQDVLVVLRP